MGPRVTEIDDQSTADDTPEDVAALYSWANLQGAKYRDYSASRREYRAHARYRAARAMLESELRAQVEAEAAATRLELMAAPRDAGPIVGAEVAAVSPTDGETVRLVAAERVEAARRAESAARASVTALREEREIAEAHASAKRQAQVYKESEMRRRQLAGPQPQWPLASSNPEDGAAHNDDPRDARRFLPAGDEIVADPQPQGTGESLQLGDAAPVTSQWVGEGGNAPAWLFSAQALLRPQMDSAVDQTFRVDLAPADTLQDSRERVASRWFALKDVFDHAGPELPAMQPARSRTEHRPLLAVFSLSGGVGKTSLLATLGRALSAEGEEVAVVDTTSQGLLSIYFSADKVRRLSLIQAQEPQDTQDSVSLFLHDSQQNSFEEQELTDQILQSGQGTDRLLIDVVTGSSWLIRRLVDVQPTVLVPMAPDMNSVISMQSIERLFRAIVDAEGRPLLPFYVLNQFDSALPLHLDVREVLRRQLGDRLLPYTVRRSPLVSEALAEGMTVVDYAPDLPVTQEYRTIAKWLRSVSPPAAQEIRGMRRGGR